MLWQQGLFLLLCLLSSCPTFAQGNAAARYEIDAKRIGVSPGDKDALPRSREFLRLDSTYYVGWLYEGLYKYSRSSDYLGFKYALAPLEKAMLLLEKDYKDNLMKIYSSIEYFQRNMRLFDDLHDLCYAMERCYNSLEMPDKTMALLDKIESYHFQRDFISINSDRAWTFHRNRFFNAAKFPFLRNSIAENEEMAFKCCYQQITDIEKNKTVNDYWYGPGQSQQDLLTVYHYLALLHDYNQHYDSSEYYYNRLIEGGRVLWGNYANLKHETGNFNEAIFYYQKRDYLADNSLSEPDYYLPTLYIYGAKTKDAISSVQQKIMQSGSRPGFGWYNIALARAYLYDGQLDSCDFFLSKASNFKELHINTTLTQSQYEFTINLLRVQLLDKKTALVKFFNPGWWHSFSGLYNMLSLKLEKLLLEYVVANALAHNPERKRIMYDLFCGESTFTFDETMYLLKDFSLPYFRDKYNLYHMTDTRRRIYRYFDLFVAKFTYEDGDEEKAAGECKSLLAETVLNPGSSRNSSGAFEPNHEKLFEARLYEMLSQYYEGKGNNYSYQDKFYEAFPQLVPFSGISMKMKIEFTGEEDGVVKKVIEDLKSCNIDFINDPGAAVPLATIYFSKKNNMYQAVMNVIGAQGQAIVINEQLIFKDSEKVGQELALRLFAKGGAAKF